jgi:heme/copper-type cytochrome/quinol oxidase subunit 1
MAKSFKPILTELLWLAVSFVVTALICRLVFFWDLRQGTLDLHLHDTYFVFTASTIIVPMFLLVTFALYFTREIRNRFSKTLPNIILLASGLVLIVLIVFVNKEFIRLGTRSVGWTMYPPLSALTQIEPGNVKPDPFVAVVANALTVLQILVTVALLYATYHWGKWRKQNN